MSRTEGFGTDGQQRGQQPGKRISPACMMNHAVREAGIHYLPVFCRVRPGGISAVCAETRKSYAAVFSERDAERGMRAHVEAMQGKDVKVAPAWLATAGAPRKKRWLAGVARGHRNSRSAPRRGRTGRQEGEEGEPAARLPQKERRQSGGPQVVPWQVTDPGKSFREDGGAGGRATLFQKGPLPPAKKAGFPSAVPADA